MVPFKRTWDSGSQTDRKCSNCMIGPDNVIGWGLMRFGEKQLQAVNLLPAEPETGELKCELRGTFPSISK